MKDLKDISTTFFEVLEYPEFTWSNYFILKQKESKWAKGIYFTALNEVYHSCIQVLQIHFNSKRKTTNIFQIEDIKLTVKDLIKSDNKSLVDKIILDKIFYAIQRAIEFDKEEKEYDPFEILSFAEVGILFIKNEFTEQTKKTTSPGFRPRTKTYFIYLIAQEAPFFDFPKLKNAIRRLLYTSKNLNKIENLLTAFHKACIEIVNIWNEELHLIVKSSQRHEIARVQFNADTLGSSWWSDEKMFDNCIPHKLYLNQDLASYAAKVANFINSEVIHGKEINIENDKKDFLNDFLRGIQTLSELDFYDFHELTNGTIRLPEAAYRDYFFRWFRNLNYGGDREVLKGKNFIDLKVIQDFSTSNIIEFKGWWNSGKDKVILQMFNYLSQFEGIGYIFIINQTRKNIINSYFTLISKEENGYIENSWEVIRYENTSFSYFKSHHNLDGQEKIIYHFIFSTPVTRKVHEKNFS